MKPEDPMARMREAHRELSASYQQVADKQKTIRKTLSDVFDKIHSIGGEDMYQATK